jgi:hypothetical protein
MSPLSLSMLRHTGICRRRTQPVAGVSAFRAVEINAGTWPAFVHSYTSMSPVSVASSAAVALLDGRRKFVDLRDLSSDVVRRCRLFEALPTNLARLGILAPSTVHCTATS